MASYYPSSESDRHASRVLQDPLTTCSDAPVFPCNLMTYRNHSSSSGSYSNPLAGHTEAQHSGIGIGILSEPSNSNQPELGILPGLEGPRIEGDDDLNEWRNGGTSMLLLARVGDDDASVLQGPQNLHGQGLSLSLSTNVPSGFPMSSLQCHSPNSGYSSFLSAQTSMPGDIEYASPSEMPSSMRVVPNPKYLKAAQLLLDEVVNVRKALKEQNSRNATTKYSKEVYGGDSDQSEPGSGSSSKPQESSNNSPTPSELSATEKQDFHHRKSKLLAMLDEVDRSYKQYYHQMQIVVSSFDAIAGSGAARPYTALALQTISRHFRSLRDGISDQVQVARKSLGEQDASGNRKGIRISRLRYMDQQIKEQRTLQIKEQRSLHQLGLMQQNAWRPQRGLPESSVTVLRAWLFEHFLHPYPKDSDKIMLARQTGLSRSQVSNWFINARVRLWKPMVEEMYKEESVDTEMDTSGSPSYAAEETGEDLTQRTTSTGTGRHSLEAAGADHTADVEVEPYSSRSFQPASRVEDGNQNWLERTKGFARPAMNNYSTLPETTAFQSSEGSSRYMAAAFHASELERLENGSNGVSLTLGLQHRDGSGLPMSIEAPHSYMPMGRRGDEM